jgi:autotransporter-associated beta strand protein
VGGAVGTLNIQGGSTVISVFVGVASTVSGNTGTVTISGLDSALTLNSGATIGAASASTGTVNVQSGGAFNSGTDTTEVNATGTINLDSGTLNLEGLLVINGALAITGSGTIQGSGSITKNGASTLTLPNANTYAGGTTLSAGTIVAGAANGALGTGNVTVESGAVKLTIQTGVVSAIDDNATLILAGGGAPALADNGFVELAAGVNEVVAGLVLGSAVQPFGTYGSTLSFATFKNDEFFSSSGILTVIPEPGATTTLLGGFSAFLGVQRFRRRS